jgi:4-hydroxy-tetrahydrodipicolinate reductase
MELKIGLCGANGRMGRVIADSLLSLKGVQYFAFNRENPVQDFSDFCMEVDVIIDFSVPEIIEPLLKGAIIHKTKLVIGTTGLEKRHFKLLNEFSEQIAIVYSANMSFEANLLALLSEFTSSATKDSHDVEIIDFHHRYKKDSPSGTAIMLGQAVAQGRSISFDRHVLCNRQDKGKRQSTEEIGISSVRAGNLKGEHQVIFASESGSITLTQQSFNTKTYADGAIKAAEWIMHKENGLYSMRDVFNLRSIQ